MMNKKKCNIYAKSPITCFTVPIVGHCTLNLTSNEIYKCLCARAEVTEILPNGKSINLDFVVSLVKPTYKLEKLCPLYLTLSHKGRGNRCHSELVSESFQ